MAKRIAMPLLTMLMTVGVSIVLKRGMYILMSVSTFILSIVFSVYTSIQEGKEFKERELKRVKNYEKYSLMVFCADGLPGRMQSRSLLKRDLQLLKREFLRLKLGSLCLL